GTSGHGRLRVVECVAVDAQLAENVRQQRRPDVLRAMVRDWRLLARRGIPSNLVAARCLTDVLAAELAQLARALGVLHASTGTFADLVNRAASGIVAGSGSPCSFIDVISAAATCGARLSTSSAVS